MSAETPQHTGMTAAALRALLIEALRPADKKIALAVSGGPDSMALLWLASTLDKAPEVIALTVDHGLRPEAAEEARRVSQWCAGRGIAHQTLTWAGPGPSTGLQEVARNARYALLAEACGKAGASSLWTAHHADDQAETVFARLARGAGPEGLAAMAPRRLIAAGAGKPVSLCRPLLAARRTDLLAVIREAELPVSHDTSNDDPSYERVRRRAFLQAAGVQNFLSPEALEKTARRAAEARRVQESVLASGFQQCGGYFHGSGAICLARPALQQLPPERCHQLLRRALEAVSGAEYAVPTGQMAALWADLKDRATLGGGLVSVQGDQLWLMREPAAVLGRADGQVARLALPGAGPCETLWDRRFVIRLPENHDGQGLELAPLGPARAGPRLASDLAASMPGLWQNGALVAVPPYAKKIIAHANAPWNASASALDIAGLTQERFFRRVQRFQAPKDA